MLKFTAQKHQLSYTLNPASRRADLLGHVATSIKDESYRCASPPQGSLFVLVTAPSIVFYSSMFPWPSQHLSSLITRADVYAIRARTTLDCFCSFCRVYHGGGTLRVLYTYIQRGNLSSCCVRHSTCIISPREQGLVLTFSRSGNGHS